MSPYPELFPKEDLIMSRRRKLSKKELGVDKLKDVLEMVTE